MSAQAHPATAPSDDEIAASVRVAVAPAPDDCADLLLELGTRAQAFAIDCEAHAAWAVDKIVSRDEQIARLKAQYADMLRGLESDKRRFEARFLPELEAWFRQQPRKGQSIRLLTGTLALRKVPGKAAALRVVDPAAALAWASAEFPGAVIAVPTLEVETLLDHVHETGEVVPGVETVPGRLEYESFSVRGAK